MLIHLPVNSNCIQALLCYRTLFSTLHYASFVYFSYFPPLGYKTFERKHYVSVFETLKFLYERELRWQTPHKNQKGEGLRLGSCICISYILFYSDYVYFWWLGGWALVEVMEEHQSSLRAPCVNWTLSYFLLVLPTL